MKAQLLLVHALSPLHPGTGQSDGAVELAIARDRATGFPFVPGSSIKGALRDVSREQDEERTADRRNTTKLFGPETARASDHAGTLVFGDANLLLLPARSVAGTFAWVTSPYLLARLNRDMKVVGISALTEIKAPADVESCWVAQDGYRCLGVEVNSKRKVIMEDLDLTPTPDNQVAELAKELTRYLFGKEDAVARKYWTDCLTSRLCIVHDDVMGFLAQHGMDVRARVALREDSKTVRPGALWHEENLPTETVLAGLVVAAPNEKAGITPKQAFDELGLLTREVVQLGGKETVGRGRCRLTATGAAGVLQ